jgi:hypothetical protein
VTEGNIQHNIHISNRSRLEKRHICLILYGLFNDAVSHTGYLAPVDKMIRELENAEV